MVWHVGVHRADHHHVVYALGDVGKQFAHLGAAFPVFGKLERGAEGCTGRSFGFKMSAIERLPVQLGEQRLGVERIHVRRAAVCEKMDDPLGTALEMGKARGNAAHSGGRAHSIRAQRLERREAEQAKAHPAALEQRAARERTRWVSGSSLGHLFICFDPMKRDP